MTPDGALSPRRIGHLGPPGTHGEEALRAALGEAADDANLVPLETNRDVVIAVERGEVEAGFVPIENSVEGAVTETLDALVHEAPGVQIVGEVVWAAHHCLIDAPGTSIGDVTIISSHPQALAQCAGWIATNLPGVRKLAQVSTTAAVQVALDDGPGKAAAIASRIAADIYGGELIAENIEDVSGNKTRFVWLAKSNLTSAWAGNPVHEASKTSLVFSGFNDTSPGGLVSILSEFSERGVNMSKIESRPERTSLGHYLFFVDLDGSTDDPAIADAIEGIRAKVRALRVLGSFPAYDA